MLIAKYSVGFFLILLCFLFDSTNATCQLKVSSTNRPLVAQNFGSKKIILSNRQSSFNLDEGDTVQLYCSKGFTDLELQYNYNPQYEKEHVLNFVCQSNRIYLNELPSNNPYTDSILSCRGAVYSMYESNDRLPNCEDFQSYALGTVLTKPLIIAGLCYDLDQLKLKYVSYKLHQPSKLVETEKVRQSPSLLKDANFYPMGLSESSLDEPLKPAKNIFTFPNDEDVSVTINEATLNNFWLRIANYELDNILQTTIYYPDTFNEFKDFFSIVWWRNLRTGNWRRFMDLLEKRSSDVIYNVYNGVSGTVRVPVDDECKKEDVLVIKYQGLKKPVPQFVWAYIQSTVPEDISKDFVVIGYNSPYFENFDKNSTVLCEDICDEIDWLTPLQNSRLISTLGKLYCCRPEEVTGILDGLMEGLLPSKATNIRNVTLPSTVKPKLTEEDYFLSLNTRD